MKIKNKGLQLLVIVLMLSLAVGTAYASTVDAYYYRQPDNTLSASGTADGDLVSTINILPSQTYYGDGMWGWPKNTNITQRIFVRNQYPNPVSLVSRVGYNPNKQSFVTWQAFSSYQQPSSILYEQDGYGNWSITLTWEALNYNVTGAYEVITKNTASDYNQWKWAHYASGEMVQAWSAWAWPGGDLPFDPLGPKIKFQPFWYWTPY